MVEGIIISNNDVIVSGPIISFSSSALTTGWHLGCNNGLISHSFLSFLAFYQIGLIHTILDGRHTVLSVENRGSIGQISVGIVGKYIVVGS